MAEALGFVSVVVPAYNGVRCISGCLEALMHQTISPESYEIIVVDDGSTDDTPGVVRRYPVRCLSQSHSGAAAARNLGWRVARGSLILFTDADCTPAPDWIEAMCAPFKDSRVSGVKGIYRTHQRNLVARFVQLEYEEKYQRMERQAAIDFVDTYSAAYRKSVLQAAGGFDVRFPNASVEDQELSFRLAKAGHRLVFQPKAVVYHQHPDTVWKYVRRKFRIGFWKALVHLRHPDKLVRDSHTPQLLKLQMFLLVAGVITLSLACVLGSPTALWLAAVQCALFFATMVPFARRAASSDLAVLPIVPAMLIVRSVALASGLTCGIIVHLSSHMRGRRSSRYADGDWRNPSRIF